VIEIELELSLEFGVWSSEFGVPGLGAELR